MWSVEYNTHPFLMRLVGEAGVRVEGAYEGVCRATLSVCFVCDKSELILEYSDKLCVLSSFF